ncbi:hypothetical protein R4Z10_21560 (plasmid) [Niallia sp. XMNu-256]|uniref:hypothetical protein n=1 Tax=Niallia sp. XMNu-256 TaxID=3082444 RepID=UPI0030CB7B4F
MDARMGLGPYIIGMIVRYTDFRGMYLSLASVVFLSILLYYFILSIVLRSASGLIILANILFICV